MPDEYPTETAGLDGTGLTEAVCPKGHDKARTVSADALFAKGAPLNTFALKCLHRLGKAEKTDAGSPRLGKETSANGTNIQSNSPDDPTLCQEFLVPVESFDRQGNPFRKNGKLVATKSEPAKTGKAGKAATAVTAAGDTGGAKLVKASDKKAAKKTKNTARKTTKHKVDSRGGKGVSVADDEA